MNKIALSFFLLIIHSSISSQTYLSLDGGNLNGALTTPSLTVTDGHVNGIAIGSNGGSVYIPNANLNNLTAGGFYKGRGMSNAPDEGWWYVMVEGNENTGGNVPGWTKQTATAYGSNNIYAAGATFIRNQIGGTNWTSWSMVLLSGTPFCSNSLSDFSGTDQAFIGSNLILKGTDNGRTVGKGASITFAVPANTDGSNIWEQARILGTPDNASNTNAQGRLYLQVRDSYNPGIGGTWNWRTGLLIQSNGNVGIGTTSPSERLSVNGNIRSKKLIVTQVGWSDYVFDSAYQLKPLTELEQFIRTNIHLPDVPSANQVKNDGIDVGENQALLLKKIEELTLYMIDMKKEIVETKKQVIELQAENQFLKSKLK